MFRRVAIPGAPPGALYLHSMPGFREPFADARDALASHAVRCMVCLTDLDEVGRYSREYLSAIRRHRLPCEWVPFPIADMQPAGDRGAFLALVRDIAARLRAGDNVLIHCAYGIGRTGTLAACVLVALGCTADQATTLIRMAGSNPETASQGKLVDWVAEALRVV